MQNAQVQFFEWLRINDPFMYDVLSAKLAKEGQAINGWTDIAKSVGKGLLTIAPAYLAYKGSKDAAKLQKAQLEFQQRKQQAPTPGAVSKPKAPPLNKPALEELKRRWALAIAGKPQPPTGNYRPVVDRSRLPNYTEAVSRTAGAMLKPQILLPLGLLASFFLFRRFYR